MLIKQWLYKHQHLGNGAFRKVGWNIKDLTNPVVTAWQGNASAKLFDIRINYGKSEIEFDLPIDRFQSGIVNFEVSFYSEKFNRYYNYNFSQKIKKEDETNAND